MKPSIEMQMDNERHVPRWVDLIDGPRLPDLLPPDAGIMRVADGDFIARSGDERLLAEAYLHVTCVANAAKALQLLDGQFFRSPDRPRHAGARRGARDDPDAEAGVAGIDSDRDDAGRPYDDAAEYTTFASIGNVSQSQPSALVSGGDDRAVARPPRSSPSPERRQEPSHDEAAAVAGDPAGTLQRRVARVVGPLIIGRHSQPMLQLRGRGREGRRGSVIFSDTSGSHDRARRGKGACSRCRFR
jgi:hypothetical protein